MKWKFTYWDNSTKYHTKRLFETIQETIESADQAFKDSTLSDFKKESWISCEIEVYRGKYNVGTTTVFG